MGNVLFYKNVTIGTNSQIEENCIIGKPPRDLKNGDRKTVIGDNAVIRSSTVIYAGSTIGNDLQTGHNVVIREDNIIGNSVSIGTNTVLECENEISDNARIHTGCFLERVVIGKNVFIGPHVTFTDDYHPPCPKYRECAQKTVVEDNVSIGANATILPGINIMSRALIGAGSVVTKNVDSKTVLVGNPAKTIKGIQELECYPGFFERPYDWRSGK